MSASELLDSIINETIQRSSFGGSQLFEQSLLKNLPSNPSPASPFTSLGGGGGGNQLNQHQLDTLNQMYATIEMGQFERLIWILLFSLMVLIAAGGNVIVVYIVSTNKEMKSVTNYFLVNLSLADTMVSTLNVIFNFISMLNSHWPFGTVYCKISNFIAILSISASVFTLTAISCDRYNAILHPLRPRMSHSHAIGWILLIWTLSSALAMPNAIYSTVVEDRLANDNIGFTCTMIWPDGRYPLSSYDHIYNIVILVVTYLVPILTMAILYYQVGKELWGYEAIGENIDKQQRAIMAKKKRDFSSDLTQPVARAIAALTLEWVLEKVGRKSIVKMMIVVVIIFALCWLPYHAFFVFNYYMPNIFQDMPLHYQRCYLFMYWLAMSNSMYNPIIIYFMNSNFRQEFRKILSLLCCCRTYKPTTRAINNTTSNTTFRTANHTQIKRQTTPDGQGRNLIKSPSADKTNNISINSSFPNNIDGVSNHKRTSLAQKDDNVNVIIETKKLVDTINIINTKDNFCSNKKSQRLSENGSVGINLGNQYSQSQQNHNRQSLANDMNKSDQEKEPFIANETLDLNDLANEKLIDFAAASLTGNAIAGSNNPKLNSTLSNSNKVWI